MISTRWGTASDTGRVRDHNEDALLAEYPVFVVADGMGGHAAGEVASKLASDAFRSLVDSGGLSIESVSTAIERANATIVATAGSSVEQSGMGTTLVGLVLVEDHDQELWLAFNVGDSRLYRLFDGALKLVTTDHSEVQELIDEGAISTEDARHHSHRNVITRALGIEGSVEPDFWLLPPAPGERFLICSDGLTNEVDDERIAVLLMSESSPTVAASRLVEEALESGGRDNISVVIVDVLDAAHFDGEDTNRSVVPIITVPFSLLGDAGATPERASNVLIDDVPLLETVESSDVE